MPRHIEWTPGVTYFKPRGVPLVDLEVVTLTNEELESIRLVDLLELEQDEAAMRMGVSRKSLWSDLRSARKKVTDALTRGKAIEVRGGDYVITGLREFVCGKCGYRWAEPFGTGRPDICPECGGASIHHASHVVSQPGQERDGKARRDREGKRCDDEK